MRYVVFLLVLCITGCTGLLTSPEVIVDKVNIIGIDSKGLDLEFYLTITNPNPFVVTMNGYSYDVQVMTLPVAKGGSRDRVEFGANAATDMRLPVRVHYGDMVEILKRRPDPDRIPYRLKAGLELDSSMGEILVPFEKNATFSVPPEYRPSGLLKRFTEMFDRISQ